MRCRAARRELELVRRRTPLAHAAGMMLTACGAASRHRACRLPSHWSATAGPPAPLRARRLVGAWVRRRPATPTAARLHAAATKRDCVCGVLRGGASRAIEAMATPAGLTRLRDHAPRCLRHPRQRCNEAAEMQREGRRRGPRRARFTHPTDDTRSAIGTPYTAPHARTIGIRPHGPLGAGHKAARSLAAWSDRADAAEWGTRADVSTAQRRTGQRRLWGPPSHICTGTGLTPATSAPGLGSGRAAQPPCRWMWPVSASMHAADVGAVPAQTWLG